MAAQFKCGRLGMDNLSHKQGPLCLFSVQMTLSMADAKLALVLGWKPKRHN